MANKVKIGGKYFVGLSGSRNKSEIPRMKKYWKDRGYKYFRVLKRKRKQWGGDWDRKYTYYTYYSVYGRKTK